MEESTEQQNEKLFSEEALEDSLDFEAEVEELPL